MSPSLCFIPSRVNESARIPPFQLHIFRFSSKLNPLPIPGVAKSPILTPFQAISAQNKAKNETFLICIFDAVNDRYYRAFIGSP